eukprot:scaffold1706_cov98-Skeletonema_marinoi.AAC.2
MIDIALHRASRAKQQRFLRPVPIRDQFLVNRFQLAVSPHCGANLNTHLPLRFPERKTTNHKRLITTHHHLAVLLA